MNCEKCGRPALALVRTGKKRSRKARAGQPRKIKDHSLCAECWEKQGDSQRVGRMKQALDELVAVDAMRVLLAENARLRAALDVIAAWSEGPVVTGGFDEPHSARVARAALSGERVAQVQEAA